MNDPWQDDIIRLLRDQPRATSVEPTATEAAAYVGVKIAEYGSYLIIAMAIVGAGIASGWLAW